MRFEKSKNSDGDDREKIAMFLGSAENLRKYEENCENPGKRVELLLQSPIISGLLENEAFDNKVIYFIIDKYSF